MSNEPSAMSRREFLKKSALAGAAYVAGVPAAAAQQKTNVFDALSHYEFTDQTGKPVNVKALRAALKDDYVTASFGFNGCAQFCTFVNPCLSRLGQLSKQKLTSIIIDVAPEADGAFPQMRDAYVKDLRETYKIKQNVVILFASQNGKPSQKAAEKIPALANELGLIANNERPLSHSAEIILFGPGGDFLAKKNGMTSPNQFDGWAQQYLGDSRKR